MQCYGEGSALGHWCFSGHHRVVSGQCLVNGLILGHPKFLGRFWVTKSQSWAMRSQIWATDSKRCTSVFLFANRYIISSSRTFTCTLCTPDSGCIHLSTWVCTPVLKSPWVAFLLNSCVFKFFRYSMLSICTNIFCILQLF